MCLPPVAGPVAVGADDRLRPDLEDVGEEEVGEVTPGGAPVDLGDEVEVLQERRNGQRDADGHFANSRRWCGQGGWVPREAGRSLMTPSTSRRKSGTTVS